MLRTITLATALILSGCLAKHQRPDSSSIKSSLIPEPVCDEGIYEAYTFGDLGGIDPSGVAFDFVPGNVRLSPESPHQNHQIRLDTCAIDTAVSFEIKLKQVVYLPGAYQTPTIYKKIHRASGVVDAIEGYHTELDILASEESESGNHMVVRGFSSNGTSFASAIPTVGSPSELTPTASKPLVGLIEFGDPFRNSGCGDLSHRLRKVDFKLDQASFHVEMCEFPGGGETSGYEIHKIEVVDQNPELGNLAGKKFTLEGVSTPLEGDRHQVTSEDLPGASLIYKWNHHNACDSFYLKFPHAEYAASASPMAGCGTPVENAPQRDFMNPETNTKHQYRIGGGEWKSGQTENCPHFFYECSQNIEIPSRGDLGWAQHNHGWNSVEIKLQDLSIKIDTPEGDDSNPDRNEGPGWRAKVLYNRVLINNSEKISRWLEDGYSTLEQIFCKEVGSIKDPSQHSYPLKLSDFAFAFEANVNKDWCDGISIQKPVQIPSFRPNVFRNGMDFVCMIDFEHQQINSPVEGIAVYVPFRYSEQPFRPFLNQWPEEKAWACIDGNKVELKSPLPF